MALEVGQKGKQLIQQRHQPQDCHQRSENAHGQFHPIQRPKNQGIHGAFLVLIVHGEIGYFPEGLRRFLLGHQDFGHDEGGGDGEDRRGHQVPRDRRKSAPQKARIEPQHRRGNGAKAGSQHGA